MATKTRKNPQNQADGWNALRPIGTPVIYRGQQTETRTEAEVLSGHTAVVWINGVAGCVALDALEVPSNV